MRNDLVFVPAMITAVDHTDAWMQFMRHAIEHGRRYEITSGSHAGSFRLSIDSAHAYIRYPETRPLYPLAKEGFPCPVGKVMVNGQAMDEIEYYFHHYILNPHGPQPNEHYNYSEWLYPLSHLIIDYYAEKGFGNAHAVMRVGEPFCFRDYFRPHTSEATRPTTPCLLAIDTRIVEGKKAGEWFLPFYIYYRCLPGNTPVMVQMDGIPDAVSLEELYKLYQAKRRRLQVLSVDENFQARWADIAQMSTRYQDNLIRVDLVGAFSLTITADHRIPVLEDGEVSYKPAINLREGDLVLECGDVSKLFDGGVNSFDLLDLMKDWERGHVVLALEDFRLLKQAGVDYTSSQRDKRVLPIRAVCGTFLAHRDDLSIGYWGLRLPRIYPISTDLAYFMGAWLANGWYHRGQTSVSLRLAIGHRKDAVRERLLGWLQREFDYKPSVERREGCDVFNISIAFLTRLLQHLGFMDGAHEKRCPSFVFSLTAELREALYLGWLEGDAGHSVSECLIAQMVFLGKTLGKHHTCHAQQEREIAIPCASGFRVITSSICYSLQPFVNETPKPSRLYNGLITRRVKSVSRIYTAGQVYDLALCFGGLPLFFAGKSPILVHNSWDLYSGFLTNLGGFQLLKEYMAEMITEKSGKQVKPGPTVVQCKDLHLYSHHLEPARIWLGLES